MKRENQISDEMLVKYLLGEASETEHRQVEQWISESPENKDQFDSFRLIWDQSRNLAATSTINENEAWARFTQRTQQPRPATNSIPLRTSYKWLKIAATVLLLAGGGWLAHFLLTNDNPQSTAHIEKIKYLNTPVPHDTNKALTVPVADDAGKNTPVIAKTDVENADHPGTKTEQSTAVTQPLASKKHTRTAKTDYAKRLLVNNKTKGFICNNTPCSFEICIIQSVKCKNDRQSPTSTCSVLEPDQSGRLHYKALNKISRHCRTTVDEITITMLSTGETLVLNDHSKPSTAQDFFNHITGKKKGDVFAGMFHTDCNNNSEVCGLTFDSNYGNLIFQ